MKMTNRRNRRVYGFWAPCYDFLISYGPFAKGRDKAFDMLGLQPGQRVVLVGVGTGADLSLLPDRVTAVGFDISPPMLRRAARKLPLPGRDVALALADAERMPFPDASFDAAVLTLVLSVVPDAGQCLREALRVLRPGGRAIVWDKFLAAGRRPSLARRALNQLTSLFGTDIDRRFEDIAAGTEGLIRRDEPAGLGGQYRAILIEKPAESAAARGDH